MKEEHDARHPRSLDERFRGRVEELEQAAATSFQVEARDRLLEATHAAPSGAALELGCGTGALLRQLRVLGRSCTGLDVTQAMCVRARARTASPVVRADAGRLPFAARSFALVLGMFNFQLVRDPLEALQEVRRVLVPGGVHAFLIQAPGWTEERAGQQAEERRLSEADSRHLIKCASCGPGSSRYASGALLDFMSVAGFLGARVESILGDSVLRVAGAR